eukprot:PLAT1828.1.p1 GENE.PLAT1828.1~~PLAT1828.1.p1  ORF type:complete len:786 (+),score=302.70 PLAT1828.1:37-2358(+)
MAARRQLRRSRRAVTSDSDSEEDEAMPVVTAPAARGARRRPTGRASSKPPSVSSDESDDDSALSWAGRGAASSSRRSVGAARASRGRARRMQTTRRTAAAAAAAVAAAAAMAASDVEEEDESGIEEDKRLAAAASAAREARAKVRRKADEEKSFLSLHSKPDSAAAAAAAAASAVAARPPLLDAALRSAGLDGAADSSGKREDDVRAAVDSHEDEMERWEMEQIRRGARKSAESAVAEEVLQQRARERRFRRHPSRHTASSSPFSVSAASAATAGAAEGAADSSHDSLGLESMLAMLEGEQQQLKQRHAAAAAEVARLTAEASDAEEKRAALQADLPTRKQRAALYASLSSFVSDVASCMEAKAPMLADLQSAFLRMYRRRARALLAVQQRAMAIALASMRARGGCTAVHGKEPEMASSSDDAALETAAQLLVEAWLSAPASSCPPAVCLPAETTSRHAARREELMEARELVFADVADDFSSVAAIYQRLLHWRSEARDDFRSAYVFLAVPELLHTLVGCQLLEWDPCAPLLADGSASDAVGFDRFPFFRQLFVLSSTSEAAEEGDADEEALIPTIIHRSALPWLTRCVASGWQPLAAAQTAALAAHIEEVLMFEPAETNELAAAAMQRLSAAADELCLPQPARDDAEAQHIAAQQYWLALRLIGDGRRLLPLLSASGDDDFVPVAVDVAARLLLPYLKQQAAVWAAERGDSAAVRELLRMCHALAQALQGWLRPIPPPLAPLCQLVKQFAAWPAMDEEEKHMLAAVLAIVDV